MIYVGFGANRNMYEDHNFNRHFKTKLALGFLIFDIHRDAIAM